jgi:hypothetical protein
MEKKKRMHNKILKLGLAFVLGLLTYQVARAEATKEIISDGGLYIGSDPDNPDPANIEQWAWPNGSPSNIIINANYTGDPETPEGTKVTSVLLLDSGDVAQWGGWGVFNVDTFGSHNVIEQDWSDYYGGAIRFWLKSTDTFELAIQYGVGATPNLQRNDAKITINSTGGQWTEVVLPFSSFVPTLGPAQLARIRSGFMMLMVDNPADRTQKVFYVDHVRWTKPVMDLDVYPESVQVNPGKNRQITVEARDAAGDFVIVYSQFTANSSVGTIDAGPHGKNQAAVLTANSSDGNVRVQLQNLLIGENILKNVAVDNTTADLSDQLGLLSETVIPSLDLDENNPNRDGSLAKYGSYATLYPDLSDSPSDCPDPQEGSKCTRTYFRSMSSNQYGGWAIQWGTFDQDDTYTKDMSAFYDGSIRFWFKGPPQLSDNLYFAIRSGNVEAGDESSQALLGDLGVSFNDQWQAVTIPLAQWAKPRPFADLSRMKVFTAFTVKHGITGPDASRTFYIDNLRWDSSTPGTLDRIEITPSGVPDPVPIPPGFPRQFIATGYDTDGNQVDIVPTWDFVGTPLGVFDPTEGPITNLNASPTPQDGQIQARYEGVEGRANVSVQDVQFTDTFNVYSDAGFAADPGVAPDPTGPDPSSMEIEELTGSPIEGDKFLRATFSLTNPGPGSDGFALWYVENAEFPRFMRDYENGFLRFHVKTPNDLLISIRSEQIDPDDNNAVYNLSELGVPTDDTWQEVIIPLANFKTREPRLNFTEIRNFFTIGATAEMLGEVTDQVFDVDDVKWLATDTTAPDPEKVYQGLVDKQQPSGFVRSFNDSRAVTYDMALAAMVFTYQKDFAKARAIFDAFESVWTPNTGFADDYHVDTKAVLNGDRTVGPNGFLTLALIHYHNAATDNTYDDYDNIISDLGAWIESFRDPGDNGIKFGNTDGFPDPDTKSTEHNIVAYAVFRALAKFPGNEVYTTRADQTLTWLETRVWNADQERFIVGRNPDGSRNSDRAADIYTLPTLAIEGDSSLPIAPLLPKVEATFGGTHPNNNNGELVTGIDFGTYVGALPDNDAVWLEGMGQLAAGYYNLSDLTNRERVLDEIRKAIFSIGPDSQGVTYATNEGTAYGGWIMNDTDPSTSAMSWYLFAEYGYNPYRPFPIYSARIKNISDNADASDVVWNVSIPVAAQDAWVRADQYVELNVQPITNEQWGIQIYTDNANVASVPMFVDPSPGDTTNLDSNPAGLLYDNGGAPTFNVLPMAWSIKDDLSSLPTATNPNHTGLNGYPTDEDSYQWLFMKDRETPEMVLKTPNGGDVTTPAFMDGEDYITVRKRAMLSAGEQAASHYTQGNPAGSTPDEQLGYFASQSPEFIFFSADFFNAGAQATYRTKVTLEFFVE